MTTTISARSLRTDAGKAALEIHELILAPVERATGTQGVTEHRFAPPRRWRFDCAWPDRMVALEIEGAVWTQGRHTRGAGAIADMEKYTRAAIDGWAVLRVTWDQVRDMSAAELVIEAIRKRVDVTRIP